MEPLERTGAAAVFALEGALVSTHLSPQNCCLGGRAWSGLLPPSVPSQGADLEQSSLSATRYLPPAPAAVCLANILAFLIHWIS